MIQVENLSFGFPTKDLYKDVSFTIENGQHCAFIGSNGTGKTTLIDMILDPEKYLYDGKITLDDDCRIGYVNQFSGDEKDKEKTVFEFLSERFVENLNQQAVLCDKMATEEDLTECNYGKMSGVVVEDIYDAVCPGEEPREIAGARFIKVLDKYTSAFEGDFAVVSHGGTINAALYCISDGVMGTGVTKLKNASVSVLEFKDGKYSVLRTNITAEEF